MVIGNEFLVGLGLGHQVEFLQHTGKLLYKSVLGRLLFWRTVFCRSLGNWASAGSATSLFGVWTRPESRWTQHPVNYNPISLNYHLLSLQIQLLLQKLVVFEHLVYVLAKLCIFHLIVTHSVFVYQLTYFLFVQVQIQ